MGRGRGPLRPPGGGGLLSVAAQGRQRLVAGLGIRPDEVARLRTVMIGSMLLGASLILYYTASNAIFLTEYGVQELPYVYIVNGLLVIAFGLGWAALGRHVTFRAQTLVLNLALAASILVFWTGVEASGSHAVIFAMMAWFRLLFIYTTLGLWEVSSRLFDIRQGKRLFSLVGLGIMVAYVLGGALTPLLVAAVGTVNLLLVSAAFLALYALFLSTILRDVKEVRRDGSRNRRAGLGTMVRDRYTRAIFSLKICSVLTAYLVEYAFYQQASQRFRSERSLAGFLGTFSGGTTLVMVLVAALVTSRLITRRGVRGTLFLMPLAMIAASVAATAFGSFVDVGVAFFALVGLAMFFNQVLEKAVYTPTLVLLFQPMPRERRLPVRVVAEGWLGSVTLVLSGVLLLLIRAFHPPNVVPYLALLAGVSAVFVAVSRNASAQYVTALLRATSRGFSGPEPVQMAADDGWSADTEKVLAHLAPGAPVLDQERAAAELRAAAPMLDDARLRAAMEVQWRAARALLAGERDLSGSWPLLAESLHEELSRVRANVFTLLCCTRDSVGRPRSEVVLDAEARINHGRPDERANAIELLDVVLPNWLKRPVVALVEDNSPVQALRQLSNGELPAPLGLQERLTELNNDMLLSAWATSVALLGPPAAGEAPGNGYGKANAMNGRGGPGQYPPAVESVLWLRTVDIFQRVPYQLLAELSSRLRPLSVSAGVRVATEGDEGDELYIVRIGQIAVQHGSEIMARMGPGSVVGELAVLDPAPRSADLMATCDTDLLILDRTTLLDLMGRRPEVAADIVTMLVRRLRAGAPEA
jgi:hypothetical protein